MILSNSALLVFSISDFAGLISRQLMLCGKFGLWPLMLMNARLVRATVNPSVLTSARAHHRPSGAGRGRRGWCSDIFNRFLFSFHPPDEPIGKKACSKNIKFLFNFILTELPVSLK